jgi:hypothetical protein
VSVPLLGTIGAWRMSGGHPKPTITSYGRSALVVIHSSQDSGAGPDARGAGVWRQAVTGVVFGAGGFDRPGAPQAGVIASATETAAPAMTTLCQSEGAPGTAAYS